VVGTAYLGEHDSVAAQLVGTDLLNALPNGLSAAMKWPTQYDAFGEPDLYDNVRSNGIIVDRGFSQHLGISPGGFVNAKIDGRRETLEVKKTLDYSRSSIEPSIVFCDFATAQRLLDKNGWFDRIDVSVDGQQDAVARDLRRAIGPRARIVRADVATGSLSRLLSWFDFQLNALVLVTFVIAAANFYESISTGIEARASFIACLRTLGASVKAICAPILLEAVAYGVIGSILGSALGVEVATLTLKCLTSLGLPDDISTANYPGWGVVAAMATVTVASLGIGTLACFRVARIPPALTIRDTGLDLTRRPGLKWCLCALGATLCGVGFYMILFSAECGRVDLTIACVEAGVIS